MSATNCGQESIIRMTRQCELPMFLDSDPEYTMKTIDDILKIQEDMLKNPNLSVKQMEDIKKLRKSLDDLKLETNDAKIKLGLVNFMNTRTGEPVIS